jgi:hypothetical protein
MNLKEMLAGLPKMEAIDDNPNQKIITGRYLDKDYTMFVSYNTVIVLKIGEEVLIDENKWNYSNTTSRYRCKFLGELGNVTKQKLEKGWYKFANLN